MCKYVCIPDEELQNLCIEKGWCNSADNEQYEKIFHVNHERHTYTLEMLSVAIWMCSDDYEDDVYNALLDAKMEYYKKYFGIIGNENGYRVYTDYGTIGESVSLRNVISWINDPVYADYDIEHITAITDICGDTLWEKH